MSIRPWLSTTTTELEQFSLNIGFLRVAYGGGAFVAVGRMRSGSNAATFTGAARSTDGLNWTEYRLGFTEPLHLARTNTGLWGCAGSTIGATTQVTSTSPDGITWTPGTINFSQIRVMTATDTRFVMVSNEDGGTIYFDSDLRGTSAGTATVPGRLGVLSAMCAKGGSVIAVSKEDVARSDNLTNWTRITAPWANAANLSGPSEIAWAGNTVVAYIRPIASNDIGGVWVSNDNGKTWTQSQPLPAGAAGGLAYNGTTWVMGRQERTECLCSRDGLTWTLANIGVFSGYTLASDGNAFVGFGRRYGSRFLVTAP